MQLLSMKLESLKGYIDRTLTAAVAGDERFWYASQHLVCITNYTTIECRGDLVAGTKRCIGYFIANYTRAVVPKRLDNSDSEVEELKKLGAIDYETLYRYIVLHPSFQDARKWFETMQMW